MSDNLELDGRRALVTGGTKGIGEAVAMNSAAASC
jgi:NAD(P)-dependent dehydrogenase (short-subunit alcohol dehydrogenase family)